MKKRHSKNSFDEVANLRLVQNQHKIDRIFHTLLKRNGSKCYDEDRKRTEKVVRYYISKCQLQSTSVERFWYLLGTCILLGKAN